MKGFLDANILFSGAQPHSRMRAFLLVLFRRAKCVTNAYAVEEVRRNLELKFPSALADLDALLRKCELVPAFAADLKIDLKEKDQPILGGAIVGEATHLLTGDQRDFGALFGKTIQGVKVVSPRMLAEELVHLGWL